jgi:hypothetical protein
MTDSKRKTDNALEKAVDRNGYTASEQISVSRLKPLRGAEGGLDTLIGSEKR